MFAPALGIHAHKTKKLGLRPSDPSIPSLRLGDYLTGVLPTVPTTTDYLKGTTFGLYGNDTYGDCGPTSVANFRRLITAKLTGTMSAPSQDDVFDLYRRSGNPNFNPNTNPPTDDNGVDMQTMLAAVQSGGIGGVKCLGYAKVDVLNPTELKAAVALFGGILFGVTLDTAQQTQSDSGYWDFKRSPVWGGHAIVGGAYQPSPEGVDVISWAQQIRMTDAFISRQLTEAWVVIWPEHLSDNTFLAGVNLQALAADYQELTGQPFPAVIPPTPNPVPIPVPDGGDSLLTIDPTAKKVSYPSDWTAVQSAMNVV